MNQFHDNAIFWVEVGKISPNPYQPRREFDEEKLQALSDSIRQYGVLQPLVVTRNERYTDDGGMVVEYELIAGERRLRAARLAGVMQVPVVIRSGEEGDNVKLELAIIENLQREDLNPVDRAQAFAQLVEKFGYKHTEVAHKIGKSREYVSNTLRLLHLPEGILAALAARRITEGHTRPLLMLTDHEEQQQTLFKEIIYRKLTVRDAEDISRRIARERVRKTRPSDDPHIIELEDEVSEKLGRRVRIAPRKVGGRVVIDFESDEDLQKLLALFAQEQAAAAPEEGNEAAMSTSDEMTSERQETDTAPQYDKTHGGDSIQNDEANTLAEPDEEQEEEDDDAYIISHFSI